MGAKGQDRECPKLEDYNFKKPPLLAPSRLRYIFIVAEFDERLAVVEQRQGVGKQRWDHRTTSSI